MKKQKAAYPVVTLKPEAYDGLPANLMDELRAAAALYMLGGPNQNGMVFIGTSPTGSGGIATFIHASHIA